MTKVQVHFRLEYPLDEKLMDRLSAAQAIYGIDRIQFQGADLGGLADFGGLIVEYDASRLKAIEVEASLRACGLPVIKASKLDTNAPAQ